MASYWLLVTRYIKFLIMNGYKGLKIYQNAFDLSIRLHRFSFSLPDYEKYEIGSQIRRSAMSVKNNIAEGYGRKRYKPDFIRFLTISQGSCDEVTSQLETIMVLYPNLEEANVLNCEYDELGRQINSYIKYVSLYWKTPGN